MTPHQLTLWPARSCAICGRPGGTKVNIGGSNEARCPACALAAETDDLLGYFGARYRLLDGRHWIDGGVMSYSGALGLLGAAREQETEVAA